MRWPRQRAMPSEHAVKLLERLKTMDMNIEHNCEFILEVLARLEVTLMPVGCGQARQADAARRGGRDRRKIPTQDRMIVRSVKRGFMWKDRVLRAEEVVIKKWKEGFLVALGRTHRSQK